MLKKLRVKFILMMMSFTILLLGSIFGLIYHFTATDLAQSSFEMMQAVSLRPARPERPAVRQIQSVCRFSRWRSPKPA